jgi:hypothetical protein
MVQTKQNSQFTSDYKSFLNSAKGSFVFFNNDNSDFLSLYKKILASLDIIGENIENDDENSEILVVGAVAIIVILVLFIVKEVAG